MITLSLQTSVDLLAFKFLWISVIVLLLISLNLILSSIYFRKKHQRLEGEKRVIKDIIYPQIFDYLDDNLSITAFDPIIKKRGLKYLILEELLFDLHNHIQGDELGKLNVLLRQEGIYQIYLELLNDDSASGLIRACRYFSNLDKIDNSVFFILKDLVNSKNQLLAFSAASAAMRHPNPVKRIDILAMMSCKKGVSKMAIVELLFKYVSGDDEQREWEIVELRRYLLNSTIPEKQVAMAILGIVELGFYELGDDLLSFIKTNNRYDVSGDLTSASIKALAKLGRSEILPLIKKKFHNHRLAKIREVSAYAIGELLAYEYEEILLGLMKDRDYNVRFCAIKTIIENDFPVLETMDQIINTTLFPNDAIQIFNELNNSNARLLEQLQ